jgi:hypothetical protein
MSDINRYDTPNIPPGMLFSACVVGFCAVAGAVVVALNLIAGAL